MSDVFGYQQRRSCYKFVSFVISFIFGFTLVFPPSIIHAQDISSFQLAAPGAMVSPTPAFIPPLIKGVEINPQNPFQLNFIIDTGDFKVRGHALEQEAMRVIKYFLASLTVPEEAVWVNLSPYEKGRVIPENFGQTAMGMDLLAEDYLLKQLTASLIYPEKDLGKKFWDRMKQHAFKEFGVFDIPMDSFHKVWIVPKDAEVVQVGNRAFVANSSLEVMMEEDYLAAKAAAVGSLPLALNTQEPRAKSQELTELQTQLMREVVIPEITKEVNEGESFSRLRQIYNASVLAAWFKITLKESILGKIYVDQGKVAGVDVDDPAVKETIYNQYLEAFQKGVYDYIREDEDPVTGEVIPRHYFSGGYVQRTKDGAMLSEAVRSMLQVIDAQKLLTPQERAQLTAATKPDGGIFNVQIFLEGKGLGESERPDLVEPLNDWYDLSRPLALFDELRALKDENGNFKEKEVADFFSKYSKQVDAQEFYPVQSTWPVLKAITLLEKDEEETLLDILAKEYAGKKNPLLIDAFFLMNNRIDDNWLAKQVEQIQGRPIYYVAAEVHHWAGGLGPVMKFHGKGMHDLGADMNYIEPWYAMRQDNAVPHPLDYTDPNEGLTDLDEKFDRFEIQLGDMKNSKKFQTVQVRVAKGIDENGCPTYLIGDINQDGSSYYTNMLYNYSTKNNPVSKEEFMAFFNKATAVFLERLEQKRLKALGVEQWKPAIIHSNDGQTAPLEAVVLSFFEESPVLKDVFWAYTTHTYANRGNNDLDWGVRIFLAHMMGIKSKYITAFTHWDHIDHTTGGVRLADWVGAVSNRHRDDVSQKTPHSKMVAVTNGAVPEEMAQVFREEFVRLKSEGQIRPDADYERPSPSEVALVKREAKKRLNELKIKTARGGILEVDLDRPLIGYSRRLVIVKAGRQRAFTDKNIRRMVELGYNVVIMGAHQGTEESSVLAGSLERLENDIAQEKEASPDKFPGKFVFVSHFTAQEKKTFLAAEDLQVQDSDNHTGAAEYSEEDITANAGLQAGPTYREGVIVDQGIALDFDHPGKGNTLTPHEDTEDSWYDTVYKPLMEIWNRSSLGDNNEFYTNAALSPRINRIQRYLITSAVYLKEYDRILAKKVIDRHEAEVVAKTIAAMIEQKGSLTLVNEILESGRNGVKAPFRFRLVGDGGREFEAVNDKGVPAKGLAAFVNTEKRLQEEFGFNAFLYHYLVGHQGQYLRELFSGLEAGDLLKRWLANLRHSSDFDSVKKKRLDSFLVMLLDGLEEARDKLEAVEDKAMVSELAMPVETVSSETTDQVGGIDLGPAFLDLTIRKDGNGMPLPVSEQPIESLMMIEGLSPVIIDVTPVPSLPVLLGIDVDDGAEASLAHVGPFDRLARGD